MNKIRKTLFLTAAVIGIGLLTGCSEKPAPQKPVEAEVILRTLNETEEPNLEIMARALILEVRGSEIVSGCAGLFKKTEISEDKYESAIADSPIASADINAINTGSGWIKRFDGLECSAPGGHNPMAYTAVVKLTNKSGASKIFAVDEYTMETPPPM